MGRNSERISLGHQTPLVGHRIPREVLQIRTHSLVQQIVHREQQVQDAERLGRIRDPLGQQVRDEPAAAVVERQGGLVPAIELQPLWREPDRHDIANGCLARDENVPVERAAWNYEAMLANAQRAAVRPDNLAVDGVALRPAREQPAEYTALPREASYT